MHDKGKKQVMNGLSGVIPSLLIIREWIFILFFTCSTSTLATK